MRSSKSRSRNKSNRQRSLGNVVNRVFDSSGPEGKVRGTPQQIIEKYLTLARDAQLSNDRVAEQSFLQHAEHYTRMLGEAQREQAERQQNQQSQRDDDSRDNGNGARDGGNGQQNGNGDYRQQERGERNESRESRREDRHNAAHQNGARKDAGAAQAGSDSGLPPAMAGDADSGPVETPESAAAAAPAAEPAAEPAADAAAQAAAEPAAEPAPAPRRRTRAASTATPRAPRSRKKPADTGDAQPDKASGE